VSNAVSPVESSPKDQSPVRDNISSDSKEDEVKCALQFNQFIQPATFLEER